MKKFRIKVAMLVAAWSLVSMGGVMADDKNPGVSKVKVVKSEQKKFRLYIPGKDASQQQPLQVSIRDLDGTLLYQGKTNPTGQAAGSFDLKNLPDGRYYLQASTDDWWVSQGLTIQNNDLSVDDQDYNLLSKPAIDAYDKNKYSITLPSVSMDDVQVTILNRWNEEMYSKVVSSGQIHRFDLSRLPSGPYSFVVRLAKKDFVEPITIK